MKPICRQIDPLIDLKPVGRHTAHLAATHFSLLRQLTQSLGVLRFHADEEARLVFAKADQGRRLGCGAVQHRARWAWNLATSR